MILGFIGRTPLPPLPPYCRLLDSVDSAVANRSRWLSPGRFHGMVELSFDAAHGHALVAWMAGVGWNVYRPPTGQELVGTLRRTGGFGSAAHSYEPDGTDS